MPHNTVRDATLDYLMAVFGDTVGNAHVVGGVAGYFEGSGSYSFARTADHPDAGWSPRDYAWPADAERLADDLHRGCHDFGHDIFVCPYLMAGAKRTPSDAVELKKIHADIDGDCPVDKVIDLGGWAVSTGSPGHAHVYVDLAEPVPLHQHTALCRALGAHLGHADAKVRPNDVLRPPGTLNHKGRARGGESSAVEWLIRPEGVRWDAARLAERLGVTLPDSPPCSSANDMTTRGKKATETKPGIDDQDADPVPFDLDAYPKVGAALDDVSSPPDRSKDTMHVVAAVRDAGLGLLHARWAVEQRPDLAQRLSERSDDDVLACWHKAKGLVMFGTSQPSAGAALHLPDSFWSADPVLAQIRRAAHYRMNSADAVLGAILARLSAHLDPVVTIDTGIKQPMPLNMFVGLVGSAGTGKTSAYSAAKVLLNFGAETPADPMLAGVETAPAEMTPTTGPGIAEAFMGVVIDLDNPKPKPTHREQVRHKLLMHSDEGAGLVASILDTKAAIRLGPTLRTAWSGDPLSDGNASPERKRHIKDYVVGLCVGFQLEALAALSTAEQLEYGMPQRFLYLSAADPAIPDLLPDDPGPMVVKLPGAPLQYCDELKALTRREALARARGQDIADPMDAHRPAMRARLAALLVVLRDPGRVVVKLQDVELADVLLDVSAALHNRAIEHRREREASERERQASARISEAVATSAAVANRDSVLDRLGERIVRYLAESGGSATWKGRDGLRQKFKSDERQLANSALERLSADRVVVLEDNTVRLP